VFNGEIYNYLELRSQLEGLGHKFQTCSDTEVLLWAWAQWGVDSLRRLAGMFAFVVFVALQGTLTCERDAFGIKPFFYDLETEAFIFASELPALRALKRERSELNWQRTYDYLVYGEYDFGDQCFVKGARSLLPGHLLTVDLSSFSVSEPVRWWRP